MIYTLKNNKYFQVFKKENIVKMDITKGQLAKISGIDKLNIDYALPQQWLNEFAEKYSNEYSYHYILSTSFWLYPYSIAISADKDMQKIYYNDYKDCYKSVKTIY